MWNIHLKQLSDVSSSWFAFPPNYFDSFICAQDVTLRELMDEDDILQECKAQNRKLIDLWVLYVSFVTCMKNVCNDQLGLVMKHMYRHRRAYTPIILHTPSILSVTSGDVICCCFMYIHIFIYMIRMCVCVYIIYMYVSKNMCFFMCLSHYLLMVCVLI